MVKRYAHFTPGHLASYVAQFGDKVKKLGEGGSYELATGRELAS
jgi:hypothetical protein